MAEGKARCTACQVEFKAKKDGTPYAHKCIAAATAELKESMTERAALSTRTCACGAVSTMGPFPGRHEADECGGQPGPNVLVDRHGDPAYPEEPDPFSSDESPVAEDHRKWCTRCKLLGHYAADCTTAVLSGGVVSVPVSPNQATVNGMVSVPVVTVPDNACSAADGYAPHVFEWNKWVSASQCVACGEDNPDQPQTDPSTAPSVAALVEAGARVREGLPYTEQPDPFSTPTQPAEELNVSGQPAARYEWYGKQNRGYLVKLPETGDFRRYKNGKPKGLTRATTFNKAATDQNALGDWKARNVLIGASKRPDLVAKAHGLTHEDNRDQLMKLVAELETTAGAKVSADVGTLIHELTEQWDAGTITMADIPAAYQPLIVHYTAELQAAGLRPVPGLIERTTYIPEFGGVVGTLDRVYYHEASGQYVIGDVKTGKTLRYGMDEIETQEWIYAHGVNNAGVYDWNTDRWTAPFDGCDCDEHLNNEDCKGPREVVVSEEWGVVVHMPVQGDDAGKVMLVRADLQRGRRHAEVCHDVRVQRANKPKPEAWTGEELKAPEMPAETAWTVCFSLVESRDQAATWWQKAYDAGVPPEEMEKLKEIADARLAELEKPAERSWEQSFRYVRDVAHAGRLWESARAAGVEPMELNRLVQIAQQTLREAGVTG